jgi:hypothetical protein
LEYFLRNELSKETNPSDGSGKEESEETEVEKVTAEPEQ